MKCQICNNFETDNFKSLSLHVSNKHNIKPKDYFDRYFKKDGDGLCEKCKNQTNFISLSKGYFKYCSWKCSSLSQKTILLRKKTKKERYGDENYVNAEKSSKTWKSKTKEDLDRIIQLRRETKKEKYGNEFFTNREKAKKTCQEKYGNEFFTNREKAFETCNKRYGVKTIFELDDFKNKAKEIMIKKYGGDHPTKVPYILNKILLKRRNHYKNRVEFLFKNFFDVIDYKDGNNITVKCKICGKIFTIQYQYFIWRVNKKIHPCSNCCNLSNVSTIEKELLEFIKQNYSGNIITNSKDIIKPYELDIYLPDLKLAFELNGLFWHNEINVEKKYHLKKTLICEDKGIHLIQIFEDDWIYKQDIVKSGILSLLGKSNKIDVYECNIREVSYIDSKRFLNENHLQGNCASKIRLGLYYKDELISIMTFSSFRRILCKTKIEGNFELLRMCHKLGYSVVGGFSKLFDYFVKNYNPNMVLGYADRFWVTKNRNIYQEMGFKFDGETNPGYFYIINKVRVGRFMFRKDVLIKQGFDKNKSEHEIMLEKNIYRIYNSGNLRYVWTNGINN